MHATREFRSDSIFSPSRRPDDVFGCTRTRGNHVIEGGNSACSDSISNIFNMPCAALKQVAVRRGANWVQIVSDFFPNVLETPITGHGGVAAFSRFGRRCAAGGFLCLFLVFIQSCCVFLKIGVVALCRRASPRQDVVGLWGFLRRAGDRPPLHCWHVRKDNLSSSLR